METYPSLSVNPSVEKWEDGLAFDPTISFETEGGYEQTRPRCTHIPKMWRIGYNTLSASDKAALETHESNVKVGADIFQWTNPEDSQTYNVRFKEGPLRFKPNKTLNLWSVSFVLKEV